MYRIDFNTAELIIDSNVTLGQLLLDSIPGSGNDSNDLLGKRGVLSGQGAVSKFSEDENIS